MGIQGLHRFVRDAVDDIHIKKYAGKQIAVDTYCWIHRGCFACADKLAKKEKTDQYVKYCLKYVTMLESYNIKPILVFDGCHLPSKSLVEEQRSKRRKENLEKGRQLLREGNVGAARDCFTKCISVTPSMALEVMNAMRDRGIDCIVAPYEADAQLAFFSKYNYVEAIITEDSDLLCFGCKKVIFKLDLCGRGQEVALENLGRVKNLVGFTPDLFRQMCILSGCDYLPSVKGVGLVKACKALKLSKSKDSYQVARKLHQYIKGIQPVDATYGPDFERADKTFLYQLVFDPYKRKLIPLNEYPEGTTASDLKFAGSEFSERVSLQIAVGNIDVGNLKTLANFDVDKWVRTRKSASKMPSIWAKSSLFISKSNIKDSETFTEQAPKVETKVHEKVKPEEPLLTNAADVLAAVEEDVSEITEDKPMSGVINKNSESAPIKITRSRFFRAANSSPKSNDSFLSNPRDAGNESYNDKKLIAAVSEVISEYLDDEKHHSKRKNPFPTSSNSKKSCLDEKSPGRRKKKKLFKPSTSLENVNDLTQNNSLDLYSDLDLECEVVEDKESTTRIPLSELPEPNGQDDVATVTISSDDEKPTIPKSPVKLVKNHKPVGLGKIVGKQKTSVVSKYFGAAKASGLRRKTPTPQQAITNFFKKL